MTPHDLWVLREPPIEPAEWTTFAASRTDLQVSDEVFGKAPNGTTHKLASQGFRWWMAHASGMPVPVVLSGGGIHIGSGDVSAMEFAKHLAVHFSGYVQEG